MACVTAGRPVDGVTWYKDGFELQPNQTNYTISTNQTIVNPFTAVYRHDLYIDDIVGVFQCRVSDVESNIVLTQSRGNQPLMFY